MNSPIQIKSSRLSAVDECDTRFRNNAKFGSFYTLSLSLSLACSFLILLSLFPLEWEKEKIKRRKEKKKEREWSELSAAFFTIRLVEFSYITRCKRKLLFLNRHQVVPLTRRRSLLIAFRFTCFANYKLYSLDKLSYLFLFSSSSISSSISRKRRSMLDFSATLNSWLYFLFFFFLWD